MNARTALLFCATTCGAAAAMAACGARTGLIVPVEHDASPADATEEADSFVPDVGADVPDVMDVATEDAVEEDVFVPPDGPDICPDAGSTLIYAITVQNTLMAFYPPTASFMTIGTINCPAASGTTPFSMAVDRLGTAYVVFNDGHLFRVSTKTAACGPTTFVPNSGFPAPFGMGFSADVGDAGLGSEAGETLYLAGDPGFGSSNPGPVQLGTLDVTTFNAHYIGPVAPLIYGAELTGTGGGGLYAFFTMAPNTGGGQAGWIGQLDKNTAQRLTATPLPPVDISTGWAFAFWGGDFYTFTAPDGADTVVQRYRPSDGSVVQVAMLTGQYIVGAGVSTCAPQM